MTPDKIFKPFRVKDLLHVIQNKDTMVHIFDDDVDPNTEIDYESNAVIARIKDLMVCDVVAGTEMDETNHIIPCIGIHCTKEMVYTITKREDEKDE